jgi:DNA repair protein RadC
LRHHVQTINHLTAPPEGLSIDFDGPFCVVKRSQIMEQLEISNHQKDPSVNKFVSVYRVSLVRDRSVSFNHQRLSNSAEAQALVQQLIRTQGQPDREQFCILMLNAKNEIIGLNIVSVGGLSSAPVHPREVLKPAILANSAALILCHNHPSNDLEPSAEDLAITKQIVRAADLLGITVHEHIIITMDDNHYYSFADQGIIKRFYDEITR